MVNQIFTSIEIELKAVHKKVEKELMIKAGHVGSFAHLKYPFIDKAIRPALVLLSARMTGKITKKTLALAAVCQYIYMASQVHSNIPEQNIETVLGKESDPRDGSQFPVLVGDFLYGKFYTTLCDYDIIEYLKPLSEIICQINEGGLLRVRQNNTPISSQIVTNDVIRKETAELFAGCCYLGAKSVHAKQDEASSLYEFGNSLGMAYGFLEKGVRFENVDHYLDEALKELDYFSTSCKVREVLVELVNLFMRREIAVRRMVV